MIMGFLKFFGDSYKKKKKSHFFCLKNYLIIFRPHLNASINLTLTMKTKVTYLTLGLDYITYNVTYSKLMSCHGWQLNCFICSNFSKLIRV